MRVIYLITVVFLFTGCPDIYDRDTQIYFENKSDVSIFIHYPLIGMQGGIYPDTTLSFNYSGYSIKPNAYVYGGISNTTIENWILSFPKDTVSIFIFDKDTLDKYSWKTIQQHYKILKRYDLSLDDFNKLSDKNGVPIITYPPTELMKDIKMFPPYLE
ncbi:MAG: hypothetical protein LIO93_03620 [Bacteroidales bacterium]|nr:hypothetical protein [Bacteroidales bacterium]